MRLRNGTHFLLDKIKLSFHFRLILILSNQFIQMKNTFIVLIISTLISSCLQVDCEKVIQLARDRECLIIVEKFLPYNEYSFNAKGVSLKNGEECTCQDEGRWWTQYRNEIQKGDTIIKRVGELTFNIHKEDTILSYQWECEGKKYY